MKNRNRFGLDSITVEDVNELFEDNNVRTHFTLKRAKVMAALIYIDGINKKDGQDRFFVENSYLCSVANIAEKNLIKALRAFEKNGYITREVGTTERQASKYFINYPKLEEGDKITTYDSEKVSSENKKVSSKLDKKVSSENKKVSSENKKVSIDIDKELELDKEKDKEYIFNIINNIIKENNINLINNINYIIKKEIENIKEKEIETMREPNVELMSNLIKSIESIKESLQLMNSSIKENSNKIETINETLQLMNSTNSDNFNKLINKIDSLKDSSIKVSKEREILTEETTNSSSDEETVKEQSNKESETTNNNKPSTVEKEKEKGCAEREKETAQDAFKSNPEASNDMDGIVDHTDENKPKLPYFKEWKKFDSEEEFLEECDTIINLTSKEHFQKNYYTDFSEYAIKSKTSYDLEGGKAVKRINKKVDADKELDKELKISTAKVIDTTPKANDTKVISKEETVELPSNTVHFHTQEEMSSYIHSHKLTLVENWEKYKINFDNLTISPKGNSVEQKENESIKETVQAETSGISQNLIDIIEFAEKSNKSKSDTSNTADGIVDHTGENKPNLPIPNEPTEDELKFEKRKQKAKELVSRLINEHMTNEQEFNEYFNKGFMWCKKFQLETYYVKLVEKYKPDVDTTEVEEEYALNDIFSNAA